jgi:hypothetical protein
MTDLDECGFALLVKDVSAPEFTQQTGGHACNHPVARGRFVSVPRLTEEAMSLLEDRLLNCVGLSKGDADEADATLKASGLRCDRDSLAISQEAWLHVVSDEHGPAILIWPNSD